MLLEKFTPIIINRGWKIRFPLCLHTLNSLSSTISLWALWKNSSWVRVDKTTIYAEIKTVIKLGI